MLCTLYQSDFARHRINGVHHVIKPCKIKRIRVGVGKATYSVVDYVLEKPSKEQQILIDQAIKKSCDAIDEIVTKGFDRAMCKFN